MMTKTTTGGTTRAQLESERDALSSALRPWSRGGADASVHAGLTASIARVDALLSLDDEQCAATARALSRLADMAEREAAIVENEPGWAEDARAFRTVAEIVRRS